LTVISPLLGSVCLGFEFRTGPR